MGMKGSKVGTMTPDEAIGITTKQYLFVHRISTGELGTILGVSRSSASRKLHGLVSWSVTELLMLATYFDVSVDDLMPTPDGMGGWLPAPFVPGYMKDPTPVGAGSSSEPPVGIEPTTYSLRVNRSAD